MKRASCSARAYFATGGLASLISVIGSLSPAQARTLGPLKPSATGMNRTDCTALRTERPEPRRLVAALPSRVHAEAAERGYELKSLVLTDLWSATIPICLGGKRHLHGSGQRGQGAVNWCARPVFLSY